jgi:hypothetical protein
VRIEKYQCPKCANIFSSEEYQTSHLCPICRISLMPQLPPKYWLFQFNPRTYNWFGWIKENKDTEQWLVSRYSKYIYFGDMVAIWCSGKNAGICALGSVISYPTMKTLDPQQAKYYADEDEALKFLKKPSVILKYSKIIDENPLLTDQCKQDNTLSSMQVLLNHEGTNFILKKEQWDKITEIVDSKAIKT